MMTVDETTQLLSDHVDMRPVAVDPNEPVADRNAIVQLDPDHPGFRDLEYRRRRNQIAQIALTYHPGDPIPDAPYTDEEHQVWFKIWQALQPAQQKHACAEYLECLQQLNFLPDRIPQLSEVNEKVLASSGFRLEPGNRRLCCFAKLPADTAQARYPANGASSVIHLCSNPSTQAQGTSLDDSD